MNRTRLLISGLALAAIGAGVSACGAGVAPKAGARAHAPGSGVTAADVGTGMGSGVSLAEATGPGSYILQSMPAGTVTLDRAAHGRLQAHIVMFGLTPGSAHEVLIASLTGSIRFPVLTADGTGQADTTLTSLDSVTRLGRLGEFIIKLGTAGSGQLATEPIAATGVLPAHPWSASGFAFHAVSAGAGRTTITFNAAAQTLTVSVTAYGLTPGPHAAHIHLGSCQSQGAVKYMLADFVADGHGDIIGQTRVVNGVTSVPGPGNWYLNLHLGGMSQILANGAPTLYFRPMLCTNITSFATPAPLPPVGSTSPTMPAGYPSAAQSASPSASPTFPFPTPSTPQSPTPTATPTPSTRPTPSVTPTPNPTGQPTHW